MLTIQDPELTQLMHEKMHEKMHEQQPASWLRQLNQQPILDLPFRSYFLLAVAFSIIAIAIWAGYLNGYFTFSTTGLSPIIWHVHEMIFGFSATIAVGFILTAAQTWTGKASIKGLPVLLFIIVWLMARVCLLINQPTFIYIAIALQSLWWLASIAVFSHLVLSSQNRRNYLFIPLLISLMLLNITLLSLDLLNYSELAQHIARTSILMFCLLMAILGGRVIPFFTSSGAKLKAITTPTWLTTLLIATSVAGIVVFILSAFIELSFSPAGLMIVSGILHIVRLSYWRSIATLKIPLLWSLHLAYFSLGFGLILLGISYLPFEYLNIPLQFSDALHLITIAAMALMIFSMMCRVSLGHTGRALIVHPLVSWLFIFIFIGATARVLLPIFHLPLLGWNSSAFLWLLAASCFLKVYFPVLTTKKVERLYANKNT
ncbi:ATP synthase F0 subunit A [Colwellia sp. 39_35_sub15_T18]|nr:ATP synthase F0 subunit A [Colwellia sp. 39_35_sub15_T18]